MARTRKASIDNDKLTDTNIARVVKLLNPTPESGEKAITKKVACEIIGIAYNTTRLTNLISSYEERITRDKTMRAEKRGKPASVEEVKYSIQEYLNGATVDAISKSLYRTPSLVKQTLEKHAVPIRQNGHNYFKPELMPEDSVRERFAVGETVYSAKYDVIAIIEKEYERDGAFYYRVWLKGNWLQFAYTEACELASLSHLRELGVAV